LKKSTRPKAFQRLVDFFLFLEQLPFGASWLSEKRAARGVMAAGLLVMAIGGSLFAVAWRAHLTALGETAFVITLVGWMMVILGFAFAMVGWAARTFPTKKGRN
jgi:hypothetical protein